MGSLPSGVVLDCDGTIADTERLADEAWRTVLGRRGYVPSDEDIASVLGHPFRHNWNYYVERVGLDEDPVAFQREIREIYHRLLDEDLSVYPDTVATARSLARAQVAIAVASSSSRLHVERVLDVAGLTDAVSVIVGAEDVERHKPDPLPYLAAARGLGLDPECCAAVEDTPVGVASARAAGMRTIAVVRGRVAPTALAAAHAVVDELTLDRLRIAWSERPHR